ncbi:unannotated protein [freshwater metagenome]|uniref:Unannotated protein n=1 Tax=freshwater metagenome TaxID=449393 RepID=A0A6J6PYM4_9ZZZZ
MPFTSALNFAFGFRDLIFAKRAISSARFSPIFTLNVLTPGNEFTILSISALWVIAGIVPFTFTLFLNNLGVGWVADSIALSSHGTHSFAPYSRNGENSPQPASPLNKATSRVVTPLKLVLVESATTRMLSSNSGNIN